MHYHAIPLMIARRLSLHALLMVAVSVLLLCHSAPALADVPSHYAYVLSRTGSVWKYALDNNEQPIPPGQSQAAGLDPYALTVDSSRGLLFMTTFTQQDLWMFRIDKATGNLRLLSTARTDLTPEAVATDGQWVFVACSAAHSVLVYEVNPTSEKLILRWRVLAGQTPTSVAVHSSLPAVYVSDYSRNFVYTFKLDRSTGELTPIGAQTTGDSPYAVAVTPSGAFAYVANRFSNSLTGYTIDASTGVLTKRDTTRTGVKPRAIAIDPTTHLLFTANEGDETVGRYTIDNDNYGRLTFQGSVESTERFPWALTVADSGRHCLWFTPAPPATGGLWQRTRLLALMDTYS